MAEATQPTPTPTPEYIPTPAAKPAAEADPKPVAAKQEMDAELQQVHNQLQSLRKQVESGQKDPNKMNSLVKDLADSLRAKPGVLGKLTPAMRELIDRFDLNNPDTIALVQALDTTPELDRFAQMIGLPAAPPPTEQQRMERSAGRVDGLIAGFLQSPGATNFLKNIENTKAYQYMIKEGIVKEGDSPNLLFGFIRNALSHFFAFSELKGLPKALQVPFRNAGKAMHWNAQKENANLGDQKVDEAVYTNWSKWYDIWAQNVRTAQKANVEYAIPMPTIADAKNASYKVDKLNAPAATTTNTPSTAPAEVTVGDLKFPASKELEVTATEKRVVNFDKKKVVFEKKSEGGSEYNFLHFENDSTNIAIRLKGSDAAKILLKAPASGTNAGDMEVIASAGTTSQTVKLSALLAPVIGDQNSLARKTILTLENGNATLT